MGVGLEIPAGAQVIEAAGKLLLPAGIDVHTHLSSTDSCDDVPTGCRAALAGGTATVGVFARSIEFFVSSGGRHGPPEPRGVPLGGRRPSQKVFRVIAV